MPRPKQRTPELRRRVLRASIASLSRDGAARFTTRSIATKARTSTPAIYELFGDKTGLVREMFFEGFAMLGRHFDGLATTADPRADLVALVRSFRAFIVATPALAELMFSRRFAEFDPGPKELAAGAAVRELVVARVQRCIDARVIDGDATDIALVLVSTTQGLAATELAGWLGRSRASRERRWTLAIESLLSGLER